MTRRAAADDIPLQIRQHLDAATYQTLVTAFTACEQAGEAAGYARAMRDCTSALCRMQDRERGILVAEIAAAAVLIVLAILWVAVDYRALVCGG